MAKLLLIDTPTFRPGINNIGDFVSAFDDDVELGNGHAGFKIVHVQGITAQQASDFMATRRRQIRVAYKTTATAGAWSFSEPEQVECWRDAVNAKWKKVAARPKHVENISGLTTQELADLASPAVGAATKRGIIAARLMQNIERDAANHTEIAELG